MKTVLLLIGGFFMSVTTNASENTFLTFEYKPFEIEYNKSIGSNTPPPRTFHELEDLKKKAEFDADSAYLLGSIYLHQKCLNSEYKPVEPNSCEIALSYYKKAYRINNKHSLAAYYIGVIYDFYLENKQTDKAYFYYEKAAQLGDKTALNNLFTAYFHGIGVTPDIEKSKLYAQKAADLGDEKFKHIIINWEKEILPYYNKINPK